VGEIARRLGAPVHRIEYVLRTRGIEPVGTAGNSRVYTEDDLARVAEELRLIDGRKDGATSRPAS
jgi:DNA-binding transcriptional MerR regulator